MVVIPDLWGKFSDALESALKAAGYVVIPDLWGKFSDREVKTARPTTVVVIPDLWGKFSDCIPSKNSIIFKYLKKLKKVKFFLNNQKHCLTKY